MADVQDALRRRGFTITDRVEVLGASTERAVAKFRVQHGLSEVGIVDQASWQALGLHGSVPHPVRID